MYYIYLITNRLTSMIYVGQTDNTDHRWNQHLIDARSWLRYPENGYGLYINKMMAVEGIDNFVFTPIQTYASSIEVCRAETWWIDFFPSLFPHGYNLSRGKGKSPSPETRAKISASLMRHPVSERSRQVLREVNIGREPWNKGTKGVMQPNDGSFKQTINWPSDEELTQLLNSNGYKFVSELLQCAESSIAERVGRHQLGPINSPVSRGENHPFVKLTEEQVMDILHLCKTTDMTKREIGERFGIARTAVSAILHGHTWSHLTGIIPKSKRTKDGSE
jgi:group I intron endonuclease